jgi:hypothetical protein
VQVTYQGAERTAEVACVEKGTAGDTEPIAPAPGTDEQTEVLTSRGVGAGLEEAAGVGVIENPLGIGERIAGNAAGSQNRCCRHSEVIEHGKGGQQGIGSESAFLVDERMARTGSIVRNRLRGGRPA